MKRVIINLMETQKDIDNLTHLTKVMSCFPKYSEVFNLFNEKYYLKTLSNKDSFGDGYTSIFLIEIKNDKLYVDNEEYDILFERAIMCSNLGIINLLSKKERKIFIGINSLLYNLLNEKEIRTAKKVYKVNLNNNKMKQIYNPNKVEIKHYKYEHKENQGHIYNKSDKQWRVRGHYRNIKGTLYWVNEYEKSFISNI